MPFVTLNGVRREFSSGTTLLEACRQSGIQIPTLCHDDRLRPSGACRLCCVEIRGRRPWVTACNTLVTDGLDVQTHSPAVEENRRTLLELMAHDYPAEALVREPDLEFQRWLRHYGVAPTVSIAPKLPRPFADSTHPYIDADLTRCITCFRCQRICEEVEGRSVWQSWDRGDATRLRPDGPTLKDSSCVSCGACVDTCPTGALEDRSVQKLGAPARWTRTTCPYCGVGCELNVGTRDGHIVQVTPVPGSAVSRGHLCVKGRYAFAFNESEDRVRQPLVREETGAPGSRGRWKAIAWTEAIETVARRLGEIRDNHGPDSIGLLGSARGTNEENYLVQKFARVVLGTNNVDCCARVCHAPSAAALKSMLGTGAATHSFEHIEHARAFLLCGTNPTGNHPIVGARIRQAVRRGARLIVIDPRETELAREADIHLALRPGTNVPLLNAMACVLVEEGLAVTDQETGHRDGFAAFIRGYTPEAMAPLCGVPADRIRAAARLYAAQRPAMCFHGLGLTEQLQGTAGVRCLVNLALLTGNLGPDGGGVNPLRGQNNVQGAAHMGCDPGSLTGAVGLASDHARFSEIWQSVLPVRPGLNLLQMLDAAEAGSLKALWAIGYDVALTNPDAVRTQRALERMDFVIVQDLFLNELAQNAGLIFLPAASAFEKDGTFMNSERRVQRIRRAVPPPGEARSDWEILCAVARTMGHGSQFAFRSAGEIWEEVRQVWKEGRGITYERLESGGLQWPCPTTEHPGTTVLSGRIPQPGERLQCLTFIPSHEETSDAYPFRLNTGRSRYHFNAGTMTGRTGNQDLAPGDTLDMSPGDAVRLGFQDGQRVRVRSRQGEIEMDLHLDPAIHPGDLFATFHFPATGLNRITGAERDPETQTPAYKVTAVRIEAGQHSNPQSGHRHAGAEAPLRRSGGQA